jgi:hypothetical protein
MLKSVVAGISLQSGAMLVVVDVAPHTGDLAKAVSMFRQQFVNKLKYVSYAANANHKQWLDYTLDHWAQEQFLSAVLTIRGAEPLPAEMPRDMMESDLALPQLLTCVWNKDIVVDGIPTPELPVLHKYKYDQHSCDEIRLQFQAAAERSKKLGFNRSAPTSMSPSGPDPKRARKELNLKLEVKSECGVDSKDATMFEVCANDVLPPAVMTSNLSTSKEHVIELHITDNHTLFLANKSADETGAWHGACGATVAAWQKGQWRKPTATKPATPNDIAFHIRDDQTLIFLGARLLTVADAFDEHQKKHPGATCALMYHVCIDDPIDGHPSHQKFDLKTSMLWTPETTKVKDEPDSTSLRMDNKHAASAVPFDVWDNSLTTVVWFVRWVSQGLVPVRPIVILRTSVVIPAGKAVKATAVNQGLADGVA